MKATNPPSPKTLLIQKKVNVIPAEKKTFSILHGIFTEARVVYYYVSFSFQAFPCISTGIYGKFWVCKVRLPLNSSVKANVFDMLQYSSKNCCTLGTAVSVRITHLLCRNFTIHQEHPWGHIINWVVSIKVEKSCASEIPGVVILVPIAY